MCCDAQSLISEIATASDRLLGEEVLDLQIRDTIGELRTLLFVILGY